MLSQRRVIPSLPAAVHDHLDLLKLCRHALDVARREQDVLAANGQRFVSHPAHRTGGADFQHPSAGMTQLHRSVRLSTSAEPPFRDALGRTDKCRRGPRVGKPAHGF
jgi:hypothetical protein